MASNDGKVLVSAMLSKSARPSTSVALGGSTGGSGSASVAAEAADDVHRVEYLLASIAMGDYLAFDELYTLFKNRVFGLAAKLLRDQGKAEEVTQEVFLQLWQQAARFDRTRGSAVAWILRIAHARSVDRIRAGRRSGIRDARYLAGHHVIERDTVVEDVLLRADQSKVRAALQCLSPIQRESIQLAYFSGMTAQQIADRIGVPRPTVKTRIRDGLIKLGTELAGSGPVFAAS